MTNLAVADRETVNQFVSTGETAFTTDFPILSSLEVRVSVNGEAQTLGVDFTLSSIGQSSGFTVTFMAATTPGDIIAVWLDMPIARSTGFSEGAAVILGSALNTEFARQVRQDQMLRRDIRRSLRLSPDDPNGSVDMVLPAQSDRVGMFLGFDSAGRPVPLSGTGADSALRTDLASSATGKGFRLIGVPRTDDEVEAGITPTDTTFFDYDDRRYGNTLRTGSERVKPSGFSYVTGRILHCYGPGRADHDFDTEQDFLAIYGLLGGSTDYFVDGVNGDDGNSGGLNDPYKTIAACMAGASGLGTIWLLPGTYTDRFDVRATNNLVSGGTEARAIRIKAWAGPGSVVFRAAGDQPGEMAWSATPAASTFDATPSGGETALHIVYHDDHAGEVQIQWYSSAANANAVASGWYQDPATKKIYLRHANLDIKQPGIADRFEIMYAGANDPIVYGGKIYLEGVTFRGSTQLDVIYQNDSGNDYRPVLFARHCKWQYMGYHNVSVLGGHVQLQDCISERSLGGDGWNYYDDAGTGQKSEVIEIDCIGRNNGVPEYSLFDGDRNKQGSSGHESSIILRVNGLYEGNYGQNIADTGTTSITWMVGSICGTPYADLQPAGIGGFYNLWTEGTTYLDSVRAGGRGATYGFWVESGVAALYRCEFEGSVAEIGANTGTLKQLIPMAA